MFKPNNKLVKYVKDKTGLNGVKFLPQNVKKSSRPALLVNKYGNGNPDNLIWMYHPKLRYVGFMVKNDFVVSSEEVMNWVIERAKIADFAKMGQEYIMVLFNAHKT